MGASGHHSENVMSCTTRQLGMTLFCLSLLHRSNLKLLITFGNALLEVSKRLQFFFCRATQSASVRQKDVKNRTNISKIAVLHNRWPEQKLYDSLA